MVLLLHGFPTSSFQYRELIPRLADRYRVIAPDLPGFGFTEVPEQRRYKYSFDALASTVLAFTDALQLKSYALYVFDYGAPVGLRLAMARPERVTAIISQNGNAYEEGLGDAWGPIRKYWAEPTTENREVIRKNILTLEGTRWQYTHGVNESRERCARVVHVGLALLRTSGKQRNSAGLVSGLRDERQALSQISRIFSQIEAAFAGDLGQERSLLHSAGSRGVSERLTKRKGPVSRYRTFCDRDPRRRNCRGDQRILRRKQQRVLKRRKRRLSRREYATRRVRFSHARWWHGFDRCCVDVCTMLSTRRRHSRRQQNAERSSARGPQRVRQTSRCRHRQFD